MTAPVCAPSVLTAPWFGRPGALDQLPRPDSGVQRATSRSATAHALLSGGTSVTRRRAGKHTFTLSWSQQGADKAATMRAYYLGIRGPGPYCLVDPAERNHLDTDDASMGSRGYGSQWLAYGSTLAQELVLAPPAGIFTSGVLRWGALTAGATITLGLDSAGVAEADPLRSVLWLPSMPYCFSVWACTVSGTAALTAALLSRNGNGTGRASTAATAPPTLTTTWQRIVIAGTAPATSTTAYRLPQLTATAAGPDVLLAAPQWEYGVTAPSGYVPGQRIPRVTFGDGDAAVASVYWRQSRTYTLAEY